MGSKKRGHRSRRKAKKGANTSTPLPLDFFSIDSIRQFKDNKENYQHFHWQFHSALDFQRKEHADELSLALAEAATSNFLFSSWNRIVKFKYTEDPLSAAGSLKGMGGRFNIPDLSPAPFSSFPALYIAEDFDTAFAESFGATLGGKKNGLTSSELSLAKEKSFTSISTDGVVESVIDLNQAASLRRFVDIIKKFSVPEMVQEAAEKLKLESPKVIASVTELKKQLLDPDFRQWPALLDLPANCQIFGQLVHRAGIAGIVYPSKHTKKQCIAVFPDNFSTSEICIHDKKNVPSSVKFPVLNAENWPSMQEQARTSS